jgi:hypothetical protein
MAKSTEAKGPVTSLVAFMKDKRRAECPVCKLSEEIRTQLASASEKGIKRKDVLEWLRNAVGVAITNQELTTHRNGGHDE